ncbi:MAG: hypothetical protein ABFS56_30395 [Pseudomonadota bacterium]
MKLMIVTIRAYFKAEKGREKADTLTPTLSIADELLREIIKNLYYPNSPYEFSVLPADILGQVYEQFLGKVIRMTSKHEVVIEDKPEVKKASGVYYTPSYILNLLPQNHTCEETKKYNIESLENQVKLLINYFSVFEIAYGQHWTLCRTWFATPSVT